MLTLVPKLGLQFYHAKEISSKLLVSRSLTNSIRMEGMVSSIEAFVSIIIWIAFTLNVS